MRAKLAVVLGVVITALLTTTGATAGSSPAARGGHLIRPQTTTDASKWLTPSVLTKIKAQGIAAARTKPSVPVTVSFAGYAFCGPGAAADWPAYDSTHQATISWPVALVATMSDFSDASVVVWPYHWTETGTQFTKSSTMGVFDYWNASSVYLTGTHPYVEFANAIWTEDSNTLTGPDIRFVQAVGPNVTGSPVCHL